MAREEKHWEVGNSNMTLFHKKDGKLWLSYLQCRDQIQMENLLIIVFWKIDNKKIEKKKNV
jgi:beta-xylosidase